MEIEQVTPSPSPNPEPPAGAAAFASQTDISKILDESKSNLTEKPKRKRATKAEMNQRRQGGSPIVNSSPHSPQSSPHLLSSRDRTAELKPAFLLYSEIFLARPLEMPEMKFSDQEAESLARVTSDLMNAFPEYFNNNDPRMGAIIATVFVAGPIGYSKWKIYQDYQIRARMKNAEMSQHA